MDTPKTHRVEHSTDVWIVIEDWTQLLEGQESPEIYRLSNVGRQSGDLRVRLPAT